MSKRARRFSAPTAADTIRAYLAQMPLLVSRTGRPYSPETVETYGEHLRPLAEWLGDPALEDPTRAVFSDYWLHMRERGLKPWTVRGREICVRAWLRWSGPEQEGHDDPALGVRAASALTPLVTRGWPALVV